MHCRPFQPWFYVEKTTPTQFPFTPPPPPPPPPKHTHTYQNGFSKWNNLRNGYRALKQGEVRRRTIYLRYFCTWRYTRIFTFSSGSDGATGVSGLSASAAWPFFLSAFLSFPFPVPGSPDLGRRGTNGILGRDKTSFRTRLKKKKLLSKF